MSASDAYARFRRSMSIGYEQWHDGIAYDLEAFAAMTEAERDQVTAEMCAQANLDWRDMEILRVHGARASFDRLRTALASGGIEERAYAIAELLKTGRLPGSAPDFQLAGVLDDLTDLRGLTVALDAARDHGGPMCSAALMRGARDRPSVAFHFGGLACYLAGATDQPWGWDLRPMLLRLQADDSPGTRAAAFAELCRAVRIDPSAIPPRGLGRGLEFPNARRTSRSNP
jgi:hypothetical protein